MYIQAIKFNLILKLEAKSNLSSIQTFAQSVLLIDSYSSFTIHYDLFYISHANLSNYKKERCALFGKSISKWSEIIMIFSYITDAKHNTVSSTLSS